MIPLGDHFRRGRRPTRLISGLGAVWRLGAVLLGSDGAGPIKEPHFSLRENRLTPTLAAGVQGYRDAIAWEPSATGVLSAMRATYRELHQD